MERKNNMKMNWDTNEMQMWFNNDENLYLEMERLLRYYSYSVNQFAESLKGFIVEIGGIDGVNLSKVDWEAIAEEEIECYEEENEYGVSLSKVD